MGQLIKNGINYTGSTGIVDGVGSTSPSLALSANQGHALANNMGAIEIGDTASQNYAIGNYFVWKSQFVRVTKAISAGDTILITGANANVESTNIGSVLTELNSNLAAQMLQTTEIVIYPETNNWKSYDLSSFWTNGVNIVSIVPTYWSVNAVGYLQLNLNKNLKVLWFCTNCTDGGQSAHVRFWYK